MSKTQNGSGNILLVANWESNVGYAWWLMENFWAAINTNFSNQGKTSFLIYPKITEIPQSIQETSINISELNFSSRRAHTILQLARFIKQHNIRYLYLSDSPPYSSFYLLLHVLGIKKIIVHDHTPGERSSAYGLRRLFKSAIQRIPWFTPDHFIAVTEFVYQRFIKVNCIPPAKCSIVSNGIHTIDLTTADKCYAYKAFRIPGNATIIVNIGRASLYKGIDFVIECANELVNKQKRAKLHFLFCGDGPDMPRFKKLCDKYKLNNNFTFAGKREDIRKILPSCDIGFHASKGEVGYSLSILEYMSAGLVTIVPDLTSTSLATQHMHDGIIYRSENIQDACDAILTAMDNTTAERLTKNAIDSVNQHFTIEHTNSSLVQALNKIIT